MNKYFFLIAFYGFINFGLAQTISEKNLTSTIQEVTVFLQGAQVFEKASGSIPAGESVVVIKGLSPYINEQSLQVKGLGNFTIQAVNKRMDFLQEKDFSKEVEELNKQINTILAQQEQDKARFEVLNEKSNLLQANKNLGGRVAGPRFTELQQAIALFERELTGIKKEEISIQAKIKKQDAEIRKLRNQIQTYQEPEEEARSEIRIRVKAPNAGMATFEFNYLVDNASWYPKYDIRVNSVSDPIQIDYKAEVSQNTGVDWKNVKLRFSNGNPNQSGVAPELPKWELNYARLTRRMDMSLPRLPGTISGVVLDENGEGLPGATVLVKGSTIGTSTDLDGRYSLTLPQNAERLVFSFIGYATEEVGINGRSTLSLALAPDTQVLQEMVVTGYASKEKRSLTANATEPRRDAAPIITSFIENQTTVEIEVAEPYSIVSNGEKSRVELKNYEIPAQYKYKAIPKLENDAFLIAQLSDWSQYSLLEGESNLYFEQGFVGRSILNTGALEDTLSISMGRDRSILINREKISEFSQKRTIGSNITESRGYAITIRNNKSQPISILVQDQIPVSVNSDISVEATELSKGKLDLQTGIVSWELQIPPGEQEVLNLRYEVKYPKREKVILD
jgi:peptidoglycan hydrolase CwlO-like protein